MNTTMSGVNRPLVSVITPSYNQGAYLEQTILSVLNQDYPHIEYTIIDGNSTDESVNIIRRYADRIAYWVSEPDEGQGHAINKGFARAKGEIVAWLNSDDLYLPGVVSEVVNFLEINPGVGMVYANCLEIDEKGSAIAWRKSRQFDLLDLLSFNIIPQPTVFLRREVVTALGGLDISLSLLFDHQMWIRVAAAFPILYKDRCWAAARLHEASKNARWWSSYGQEATAMLNELSAKPDMHPIIETYRRQILAGIACFAGNYALVNGDLRGATQEFAKALRLQPDTLRRVWKQLVLLPLLGMGLLHPGEEFNLFRRRYKSLLSPREPDVIQKQLRTLKVR